MLLEDDPARPQDYCPGDLARALKRWGNELGFQSVRIADVDLSSVAPSFKRWLSERRHGAMGYMERHFQERIHPPTLHPGTVRVISARMDYLPQSERPESVLNASGSGYVARYALGRDYHKVMRARLRALAERLQNASASAGWRVFVDSAPVMEVELARKAGVGWRGKHTLLIDRSGGSFFFLGEIFTDLPLPLDSPVTEHCGRCTRCIDACPTGAITGPFQLDARRCISYLTIELKGPIPQELRPMIGNRIYGCDDCQIVCPWNKFARLSVETDFSVRHGLDAPDLVELFAWDADSFRSRLAGSAIYRIGHERWLRNIAVALGNATTNQRVIHALRSRSSDPSPLVREHVAWALARHEHNRDFS